MRNPGNIAVVLYPTAGVRIRNCQTTVKPTKEDLGPVTNFNAWSKYIKATVHQPAAPDERLLAQARLLLIK